MSDSRGERTRSAARIRAAVPADVERVWELMRGLAVYEKLEHEMTGSAERIAAHVFGGAWPAIECLVAETDQGLVGYAIFYGTFSTFWTVPMLWLEDLYVEPSHRGSGAGRELLRAVAAAGLARGCARVDWAVLEWNEPAIGFYESLGARRAGGWHTYRLEGAALEAFARLGGGGAPATGSEPSRRDNARGSG